MRRLITPIHYFLTLVHSLTLLMGFWMRTMSALVVGFAWLVFCDITSAVDDGDQKLPAYQMTPGPAGLIRTVGSDTMNSLMVQWTESFKAYYRGVRIEVEGQGSSKAMPSLIEGASSFGPMSRELKSSEIDSFEARFGYKPTVLPIGIDLVAVFVHKDCPLQSISIEQLDAIFSNTRKRGMKRIAKWGDLGVEGEWADQSISLFGRNAASGTYGFFKHRILDEGDYLPSINELPGSSSVVASIGENRFAMGYCGMGFGTNEVKALTISERKGALAISPTEENAINGSYPLARYLYLATNYRPRSKLDPLRREFVKFIYSREGQRIVQQNGYVPIDREIAFEALDAFGLSRP